MQNKQLLSAIKQIIKTSKVDDAINILALAVLELDDQQSQLAALPQRIAKLERKLDQNDEKSG